MFILKMLRIRFIMNKKYFANVFSYSKFLFIVFLTLKRLGFKYIMVVKLLQTVRRYYDFFLGYYAD